MRAAKQQPQMCTATETSVRKIIQRQLRQKRGIIILLLLHGRRYRYIYIIYIILTPLKNNNIVYRSTL